MRVALAMIPLVPLLMGGCSELDPNYAVSQWTDGVEMEENRPTPQSLHTVGLNLPGQWARTMDQAYEGSFSWRFGDGSSWPTGCDASLETPDFEAGRASFLRFAWYSDIPPLSPDTALDGAVIEVQVENEPWELLTPNGGYPFTLDPVQIGSPLSNGEGILSGNDRQWREDYVGFDAAELGQTIRFRFRFGCDIDAADNTGAGLFIDDVEYLIVE